MARWQQESGKSIAEDALEAWIECKPTGCTLQMWDVPDLLPRIAARVPKGGGDLNELFVPQAVGEPALFQQLLRPHAGEVHFLNFWRAFSEAARMAGAPFEDGLTSEMETLRDRLLRTLDKQLSRPVEGGVTVASGKEPAQCSSSSSRSKLSRTMSECAQISIPRSLVLDEVRRAESMSACPDFWRIASQSLTANIAQSQEGQRQELSLLELTCVLLELLRYVPIWDHAADVPSPDNGEVKGPAVLLHIYDVSQGEDVQQINRIFAHKHSPLKFGGVFHAAVEVNGLEWSFGYVPSETKTGVYSSEPKKDAQHHYRQTVILRRAQVPLAEIPCIISDLVEEYSGKNYDLLRRNCCNFADDLAFRLGAGRIPGWVHRLARLGATVDNILQATPRPLKERIFSH